MTSCCCWFIQPASEISKSRKGSRARVIATSYTPERPLARQTALSLAFCFQRDRVFGHYVGLATRSSSQEPLVTNYKCKFGFAVNKDLVRTNGPRYRPSLRAIIRVDLRLQSPGQAIPTRTTRTAAPPWDRPSLPVVPGQTRPGMQKLRE